jgi:hypothetical protein
MKMLSMRIESSDIKNKISIKVISRQSVIEMTCDAAIFASKYAYYTRWLLKMEIIKSLYTPKITIQSNLIRDLKKLL